MSRPAKRIIDLTAIQANCELAQSLAPQSKTLAVVKADAYGHGSVEVSKALEDKVEMLTVSCLAEALTLRDAGIVAPILLLEGFFHTDDLVAGIANNCQFVIHNSVQLEQLLNIDLPSAIKVWLKVDTGMHRLGIPVSDLRHIYQQLKASKNVSEIVLLTHFSCADDISNPYTQQQLRLFKQSIDTLPINSTADIEISMANSAAILAWPESYFDWHRPGIMLYGLSPFLHSHKQADKLIPVMTFQSEVIAVRQIAKGDTVGYGNTWRAERASIIATVAVGYGDGYPRSAKSGTPVLINQQRAPIVGRVSMDLISVDITDITPTHIGDTVVLWGKSLSANEVASWANTIGYELVTRMPKRAPLIYQ